MVNIIAHGMKYMLAYKTLSDFNTLFITLCQCCADCAHKSARHTSKCRYWTSLGQSHSTFH